MPERHEHTPAVWYLAASPAEVDVWLGRLRWLRAGVEVLLVFAGAFLPEEDFPLRRLAPLMAAAALADAEIAFRLTRHQRPHRAIAAVSQAVDVVLLTGLLELSGGPSNPFSVVYAFQMAVAAATLGRRWAALVAGWIAISYGVLISWHLHELVPAHHRLVDFPTHLFTMWLAIAVVVELAAHFIKDASAVLIRREAELEEMRQRAARTERLISLTTLAAGAAHELSTPLATIAIASKELDRALDRTGNADWTADARLIRSEVDRCQTILDQMSGRAGGRAADLPEIVDLPAVLAEIRDRLNTGQTGRLQLTMALPLVPVRVPRAGLVQVLLSLVKNAFDATDVPSPVMLQVDQRDGVCRFVVRDEGPGMSEDVLRRAGEPFFSTKEPGRGTGLGLFLARMFAERCGGRLAVESELGTTAILELPLATEIADPA
jgi:two-component system sensor histidine kinase RegB